MYYLRSKPSVNATKFTVNESAVNAGNAVIADAPISPKDFRAMIEQGRNASENDEECGACGAQKLQGGVKTSFFINH